MPDQKIVTFLWFNNNAEEAVNFYCSVFERSKILDVMRCGGVGPGPRGSVLTITFELEGQQYIALNGGPTFKFNEAISLLIQCDTQDEVDHYWSKLTSGGGQESQCGWLKDKFGLSWQIVPRSLPAMMSDPDPARVAYRKTWTAGDDVTYDTSRVRKKNTPLKTKGGRASGPDGA